MAISELAFLLLCQDDINESKTNSIFARKYDDDDDLCFFNNFFGSCNSLPALFRDLALIRGRGVYSPI